MSELSKAELPYFAGLLLRTRRRIWLESISRLLFSSAWWSGGLIFVAGLVHGLGVPLSWRHSLLLALVPAGIAAAVGLMFRRPTPERVAAQLDICMGSKELMVSALAQGRLPLNRRAGAASFVLRQAEHTAATAGNRCKTPRRNPAAVSILIPSGLAVAGLILHLNVGLEGFSRIGVSGSGTGSRTAVSTVPTTPAAPTLDLKRSLMQIASSMSMEGRRPQQRTGRSPGRARSLPSVTLSVDATIDSPTEVRANARRATSDQTIRSGRPPTFDEQHSIRGLEGAGSLASGPMKAGKTPPTDLSIEFMDIERRRGSGAAKEGHVLSGVDPVSEDRDFSGSDAIPPVERVDLAYENSFGPAMRAYVRAYFSQLQQDQ